MNPVDYAEQLLEVSGLKSRDSLRDLPSVPRGRWIVRRIDHFDADEGEQPEPLDCAAILGLSGPSFFSADRPVIWTRERLSRVIQLYRLGGFYED